MIPTIPVTLFDGQKNKAYYGFSTDSTSTVFEYTDSNVSGILDITPESVITIPFETLMEYLHLTATPPLPYSANYFPWILLPVNSPSFPLYPFWNDEDWGGNPLVTPSSWYVGSKTIDGLSYRSYKWRGAANAEGVVIGLGGAVNVIFKTTNSK